MTYTKDVNRKRNQRQKVRALLHLLASNKAPGAHKLKRRAALCAYVTAEPRCSTAQKKTALFAAHRWRSPQELASWRARSARLRKAATS